MSAATGEADAPGPGSGPGSGLQGFPSGSALRRWTRRRTRRNASGPWALVGNVYTSLLALAILAAVAWPRLSSLVPDSSQVAGGPSDGTGTWGASGLGELAQLDPAWLSVALVMLLAALAVVPLRRLGPLFLRPHEAAWWLPLPGDRRGLLLPVVRTEVAVAALVGWGTGAVLALLAGAGVAGLLGSALLGGAALALLLLSVVASQLRGTGASTPRVVLLAASTGALVASAVAPPPGQVVAGRAVWVAALTATVGAVLVWRGYLRPRLGVLHDSDLLEVVSRSFGAHVSLLALDTRALGRLLSPAPSRPSASSHLGLARLALHLPRRARPVLVVAQADWLLLRRQPRRLLQVAAGLLVALVPVLAGGTGGPVRVVAHLLGGWIAVLAVAEPARQAWFDGGADESWPVAPVVVRLGHLLVPAAVMTVWTALALAPLLRDATAAGALTRLGGTGVTLTPSWWAGVGIVVAAGLGWGAAALRSGFRSSPDFSAGLVASPMGSLPPGAIGMVVAGPDAAIVAGLPAAMLVLGTSASTYLLAAQVVASAVVVTWGLLVGRDR